MIRLLLAIVLWALLLYHAAPALVAARYWLEARYPQHLPWVPLAIDDALGYTTRGKLQQLAGDLPACLATLEAADLAASPTVFRASEPACEIPDAVTLQRMHYPYAPASVPMSCPLAVSLGLWERHIVAGAAQAHLQETVARIHHLGTWNCRPIAGRARGTWSRHATATAIDIAGFELSDGRVVSVLRHYADNSPEGRFLQQVKQGACDVFGTVLSPEYNAAHADHFHLQQRGGLCR